MSQPSDEDLVRFSRFLLAPEVSEDSLRRLRSSRVAVVGVGGLGCPVALYLAAAGIGRLRLIDPDTVEISNLPRQILFGLEDTGRDKAQVAAARLGTFHPETQIEALAEAVTASNAQSLLSGTNLVIDCTDRFAARQVINEACHRLRVPLVIGSALQWSGQLLVVDPRQKGSGCYACLFPTEDEQPAVVDAACGAYGVVSTAVGLVGLMQANEALKVLMGMPA
ncbi:MAG: HesA/MoeB/ThiF family protein, partial [Proteobacteria bacterium]|nr:HesA/MoeB/ThiF family protein [Pseudomonadota bacterium]